MFVLFVLPHIYKRMAIDSRRTNISNELYPPFGKHFLLNRSVGRSVGFSSMRISNEMMKIQRAFEMRK